MERLTLLGLPLDPVDMEEALKRIGGFLQEERTHQVVTLNPEIAVRAQEDEALRRAVLEAELVTPDGVGILWAVRRLHGLSLKERVTGIDLTLALLRRFPGVRVYLLGGKPGVAGEPPGRWSAWGAWWWASTTATSRRRPRWWRPSKRPPPTSSWWAWGKGRKPSSTATSPTSDPGGHRGGGHPGRPCGRGQAPPFGPRGSAWSGF